MVPNDFKREGYYYNVFNNHHHLNPKTTKQGKYGYNRSEVISKMGNLSSNYNIAGGQVEPDFYRQIDDLENYVTNNKRAPVHERSYRTNSVMHSMSGGPFMPPHQFIVNSGPSFVQDRIVVNEFDVEWFIRHALKWDDIYVSSYNQLEDVKERVTKFLANFNGIHDYDVYRGGGSYSRMTYFPWEDFELFQALENCRVQEEEMLLHLSRIPDDTLIY